MAHTCLHCSPNRGQDARNKRRDKFADAAVLLYKTKNQLGQDVGNARSASGPVALQRIRVGPPDRCAHEAVAEMGRSMYD